MYLLFKTVFWLNWEGFVVIVVVIVVIIVVVYVNLDQCEDISAIYVIQVN